MGCTGNRRLCFCLLNVFFLLLGRIGLEALLLCLDNKPNIRLVRLHRVVKTVLQAAQPTKYTMLSIYFLSHAHASKRVKLCTAGDT